MAGVDTFILDQVTIIVVILFDALTKSSNKFHIPSNYYLFIAISATFRQVNLHPTKQSRANKQEQGSQEKLCRSIFGLKV